MAMLLNLLPVLLSLAGFIVAILGLFAGSTPGFMEEYQIIMLNTSVLGRNYVPQLYLASANRARDARETNLTASAAQSDDVPARQPAKVWKSLPHAVDDDNDSDAGNSTGTLRARQETLAAAENQIAGLTYAEAAVRMAGMLGISEFYTLHVMNACEGSFAPNASAPDSWRNVTNCTAGMTPAQLNLSGLMDGELQAHFTGDSGLRALGASASLVDALNRIPAIAMAIMVFYVIGVIGGAVEVLVCLAALVVLSRWPREVMLAGFGAAAGAATALVIAALVTVIAAGAVVRSINRLGKETIGMQASRGAAFTNTTWAAAVLMLLTAVFWVFAMYRRSRPAPAPAPAKEAAAEAAAE